MNTAIRQRHALFKRMKAERACAFGWGHFKHWLVRNGVIANPSTDVPRLWQDAFKKLKEQP
jgi:hypothetical protein